MRCLPVRKLIPIILSIAIMLNTKLVRAQGNVHQQSQTYQWPSDPLVKQKLEQWQDQKFGMIIHWGLYSVPGIIESWALCSEDWIARDSTVAYDDFKKWYWGQNLKFNPVRFDPDQWAAAAKSAGMRYLVFTTKHHDGYCMFDTRQTDFKVTGAETPFSKDPQANVTKHVFEAFRKQNFMIGAYFSKPDWHTEYYWWPKYATADRNNNYDIRKYPWRWNQYKQFTYDQISELMHGYGKVDILWLDGGWVRPLETVNDEVRAWGAAIPPWSQDIDMPRIATMARQAQPGLLMVDRTVHGPYENYQTPEQQIPKEKLDHPWESCITLGNAWGYVPNDQFKSPTKVIHSLIEVVAKGGSLLLGVGPQADGLLSNEVVQRLTDIGKWLDKNGAGIYHTRATSQFRDGEVFFTQNKAGSMLYALVRVPENESLPATVEWTGNAPHKGTAIRLLMDNSTLKWERKGDKIRVLLPTALRRKLRAYPALALAFAPEEK